MAEVPSKIRRYLRRIRCGGSRAQRRVGTKSHKNPKPRQLLAKAIEAWKAAGCPDVPPPSG